MNRVTAGPRDGLASPLVPSASVGGYADGGALGGAAATPLQDPPTVAPRPALEPRSWSTASDDSLRRAAAFGDLEAFHEIVGRHGPAMYRYAQRTVSDRGDAEEAVQDAFVAAWQTLPDFRGDSSLRTWLFTITRRKAIDLLRKRRPVPVGDDMMTELVRSDEQDDAGSGFLDALEVALAKLPETQRSVWLLREVEQLSYAEIASVLRSTETVVRGQLSRARANLQAQLRAWKP
ncbi:RNA polymerase sigma factor [Lapillicoccus jejuensis]|uniref:RNA polymerase sigma-70 factor (ECF subfamily) n=1 Tax=Lapillicoccus jejuensis TaxID=402171 RepID=A0A542DZ59_9MICO|nr:sigma-70 family RNA polymerase sigma factor [Lapillicoccus jejuensis]TQJ08336.1 RNA polymerase sigma-70 factor (ECF subfamily) [Lapillicoccus jejuensis]